MKKFTRLKFSERKKIEEGIKNGMSVQQIADSIGKERTAVYREIKKVCGDIKNIKTYNAQKAEQQKIKFTINNTKIKLAKLEQQLKEIS